MISMITIEIEIIIMISMITIEMIIMMIKNNDDKKRI